MQSAALTLSAQSVVRVEVLKVAWFPGETCEAAGLSSGWEGGVGALCLDELRAVRKG